MALRPLLARGLRPSSRFLSSNPFADAIKGGCSLETGEGLPYETGDYAKVFKESVEHPEDYWGRQAQRLVWHKQPERVLDNDNPPFTKWFVGGELSTCYNALDRHVEAGLGETEILVYDSPITQTLQKFTYGQLLNEVKALAGALREAGVGKGDRVLIYMPMIPQTLIAMLATARLGAAHIVVFGGFAAKELSIRINHARPTVVVSASCGLEPKRVIEYKPILDEAMEFSNWKPRHCIVYTRPNLDPRPRMEPGRDLDWVEATEKARPAQDCVPIDSQDPIYLIHTSGTTGLPKGIVRPSGGHAVVMPWSMQTLYGVKPGECWWAASDFGWVVGHSYTAYAPLMFGARSVLYEGKPVGTPDAGQFFRVLRDHDVASFFCAPTALRSIHQHDPHGYEAHKYPLTKMRVLFSAGEKLDMDTRRWAEKVFQASLPDEKGAEGLEEEGKEPEAGALGRIVVKLPLPPGAFSTLWENDHKFNETYFTKFPGYYDTMDAGLISMDGSVSIMSRVDDVINVAGHRISGGAIEEAILDHSAVVDCAVVGKKDDLKGDVPAAFCVVKDDWEGSKSNLRKEVISLVRREIGAVAALKIVFVVPRLPKTRSGKVAHSTLAAMINRQEVKIPVTIEDAGVYPEIEKILKNHGILPLDSTSILTDRRLAGIGNATDN